MARLKESALPAHPATTSADPMVRRAPAGPRIVTLVRATRRVRDDGPVDAARDRTTVLGPKLAPATARRLGVTLGKTARRANGWNKARAAPATMVRRVDQGTIGRPAAGCARKVPPVIAAPAARRETKTPIHRIRSRPADNVIE